MLFGIPQKLTKEDYCVSRTSKLEETVLIRKWIMWQTGNFFDHTTEGKLLTKLNPITSNNGDR